MFPRDAAAKAELDIHPLSEPVTEAADDRRVRAATVQVLEVAATQGHTVLHDSEIRDRIGRLRLEPLCQPGDTAWEIACDGFPPVVLESATKQGEPARQLDHISAASDLIRAAVEERIAGGPLPDGVDWASRLDSVLKEHDGTEQEDLARAEKAEALGVVARARIGCLVGPAGTGKTTLLDALCGHEVVASGGVLLLAPTGKARVQLADKVHGTAMTLAQYLARTGRFGDGRYRVLGSTGAKLGGWETVVVDEASMLTEQMVASLLDALDGCRRLLFVGDHRQLPPIGAGRPFFDLIRYLEDHPGRRKEAFGGGLAELIVQRRQRPGERGSRDDLAVAALFATDRSAQPAADDVYRRLVSGQGDGTVRVMSWQDPSDLDRTMADLLASDHSLSVGNADALKRSLGATEAYTDNRGVERPSFPYGRGGSGAEAWQVLSPVRSRSGGVDQINRLVRRTWRGGDAHRARSNRTLPPPMGPDEILFHDKVMCLNNNHHASAYDCVAGERVNAAYANGEIGMVSSWPRMKKTGRRPDALWVEFATQPELRFTFWKSQIDATGESSGSILELAYAVTIHKAQGSEFAETYVVVPQPCSLLSPELLYTALTRQANRVTLLVQGDPSALPGWGHLSRSETAHRLTCLFAPADPTAMPTAEGASVVVDGKAVHKTTGGLFVKSKSEVAVANILHDLVDGVQGKLAYERPFARADGWPLLPDFTIELPSGRRIIWEHLGMLDQSTYGADWRAKLESYLASGVTLWPNESGINGTLVTSTESVATRGLDTQAIVEQARAVIASG